MMGPARVGKPGGQVLGPQSRGRQATQRDRPPGRALQLRTWSGQEVRAGLRGSVPITARGLGLGKGRIVTMPSWSLPSDWPEFHQPDCLGSKAGGGAWV